MLQEFRSHPSARPLSRMPVQTGQIDGCFITDIDLEAIEYILILTISVFRNNIGIGGHGSTVHTVDHLRCLLSGNDTLSLPLTDILRCGYVDPA